VLNNIDTNNTTTIASGDYSNSLNMFVYEEVPEDSLCLDVGCWTGNLGRLLKEKKRCVVDGIEVNRQVSEQALRKGYRNVFIVNLNNDSFELDNTDGRYDVIIFADVLEHLVNPVGVLTNLMRYLKPDGIVIVSLPNVAFILNRLLLLMGKWDYKDFGTLDKTHLKFYTVKSGAHMVESAGLELVKVLPYNQFGILTRLNYLNKLLPTLFSYQFLVVAKNENGK